LRASLNRAGRVPDNASWGAATAPGRGHASAHAAVPALALPPAPARAHACRMPPCVSPSLLVDRHHSESDTKQRPLCHFHRRQAVGLKGSRSIGIGSIDRILPRVSDLVSPCQPRSFRRHRHRAGAGSGQNRSGGDHAVAVQRHRRRRHSSPTPSPCRAVGAPS
jgi:hypothetical protein